MFPRFSPEASFIQNRYALEFLKNLHFLLKGGALVSEQNLLKYGDLSWL